MEYYYTPKENVNTEDNTLSINGFEYKHLTKVLRKNIGDEIYVTDGLLNIYQCKITTVDNSVINCHITGTEFNLHEPDVNITLIISPLKNISRFEFAIEKAVELGVKSIQPVITEHTVSKNSFGKTKVERFNKIIISAMGQSQRCYLPVMTNAITFSEMIDKTACDRNKIVMYEFSHDQSNYSIDNSSKDVCLLIGPEGGFSKDEISQLRNEHWKIRSLGERKLRAETAAIISLHELLNV